MKDFCTCSGWKELKKNNSSIIKEDPVYGWVLSWIELTEDEGYTQVHRYGISINFCPMCGKKIKAPKDD